MDYWSRKNVTLNIVTDGHVGVRIAFNWGVMSIIRVFTCVNLMASL